MQFQQNKTKFEVFRRHKKFLIYIGLVNFVADKKLSLHFCR